MKIAYTIVRILMGLMFLFSSIAFFFTQPPPMQGNMKAFFDGLVASKYLLYFIKLTEFTCGAAFLTGRFVPLATVVICPVILNIVLVNAFLMPEGLALALPLLAGNLFLAWVHWEKYKPMLAAK